MAMIKGFQDLEYARQRQDWERIRWQTTYQLNVHTKKGKTIKPSDLIVFDWDNPKKPSTEKTEKEKQKDRRNQDLFNIAADKIIQAKINKRHG